MITFALKSKMKYIMDTTSLGINQGSEELFIGWIIVIIGLIVVFFLSKMNKKEDDADVDVPPTHEYPESNNETQTSTNNLTDESSSNELSETITSTTGEDENSSDEPIIPPSVEPLSPELPSKPKYIGYNPTNIFAQTEPLNYPYVIMPSRPECVIKFLKRGGLEERGYKEESSYNSYKNTLGTLSKYMMTVMSWLKLIGTNQTFHS